MLIDLDEFAEAVQQVNHGWTEVRVPELVVMDRGETDHMGRSLVFRQAIARVKAIESYYDWIRDNTKHRVYHVASIFVFEDPEEAFMFKLTLA